MACSGDVTQALAVDELLPPRNASVGTDSFNEVDGLYAGRRRAIWWLAWAARGDPRARVRSRRAATGHSGTNTSGAVQSAGEFFLPGDFRARPGGEVRREVVAGDERLVLGDEHGDARWRRSSWRSRSTARRSTRRARRRSGRFRSSAFPCRFFARGWRRRADGSCGDAEFSGSLTVATEWAVKEHGQLNFQFLPLIFIMNYLLFIETARRRRWPEFLVWRWLAVAAALRRGNGAGGRISCRRARCRAISTRAATA